MKKYILYGGYVTSVDGDDHYISPMDLVRLYKLRKDECILVSSVESTVELRGFQPEFLKSLTELHPKVDGLYSMEEMRV